MARRFTTNLHAIFTIHFCLVYI